MEKLIRYFLIFWGIPFIVQALTIKKISNEKILLQIEDEEIDKEERYLAVDENGKPKGLIKIKLIKEGFALGNLEKGSVLIGQKVIKASVFKKNINSSNIESNTPKSSNKNNVYKKKNVEIYLGMASDNLSVDLSDTNNTETVKLNGIGKNLEINFTVFQKAPFDFRLIGQYEMFSVTGTSKLALCGDNASTSCMNNLNYLNGGGELRLFNQFNFGTVFLSPYFLLKYPISKSSSVLESSKIGLTSAYGIRAGGSIGLGNNLSVPFYLGDEMMASGASVKYSSIRFGLGISWGF